MDRRNILLALVVIGALLIVALGTIIPLPPIVTGEEGISSELAKQRVDTVAERYKFQEAMLGYQKFLANNYIPGSLPSELRALANQLAAGADPAQIAAEVKPRAELAQALGEAMYPFAQTSEDYFKSLRGYEDDLMTWSRTLGPRSEELREATWPFIAWTSLYPEPVGTDTNFHFVAAADVRMALENLRTTVAALEQNVTPAAILRVSIAAAPLWDFGRDLPNYARFHDGYFSALRQYDNQSVDVAATPELSQAEGQTAFAYIGSTLVGLLLAVSLLLLFAPARLWAIIMPYWERLPFSRMAINVRPFRRSRAKP